MKRDSLFFRFFKELPSSFFQMIGRPETDPARFELEAIEYKETAVRLHLGGAILRFGRGVCESALEDRPVPGARPC
jgi:hypothetical protein